MGVLQRIHVYSQEKHNKKNKGNEKKTQKKKEKGVVAEADF